MKTKLTRLIQICFVAVAALIMIGGLCRAVLHPKDINGLENRKANQLPELGSSVLVDFASSAFQDSVEKALSDQVLLSEYLTNQYNSMESYVIFHTMNRLVDGEDALSYSFNGLQIRGGDRIVHWPRGLKDSLKALMEARAENINSAMASVTGPEYYVYYIEKDTDMEFGSGKKMGQYAYLEGLIDKSLCKVGAYEVNSYEEFCRWFYKTDSHWNHVGSYRGYTELLGFLEAEGEAMVPGGEFMAGERFSGSKAITTRSRYIITEDMPAYRFDFPDMLITVNGETETDYGQQNEPLSGRPGYGVYYGGDAGEVVFDMSAPERENLLIIGESFDNAILKLLATHFDKTFGVDLRYYSHYMGEEFSLGDYVEKNEIDKVLFFGNMDFFTSEEFMVR